MVSGAVMPARPAGAARERARSRLELIVGAVVILAIVGLLAMAVFARGANGRLLKATFSHVDGLGIGSDVKIAGVTVGKVVGEDVDAKSFLATVSFRIRPDISLSTDSSAAILSEGLLGGKYLSLTPGGEPRDLPPGGLITATQGSISLEALLGKFIGSVEGLMDAVKAQNARAGDAKPGSGAGAAPLGGSLGQ